VASNSEIVIKMISLKLKCSATKSSQERIYKIRRPPELNSKQVIGHTSAMIADYPATVGHCAGIILHCPAVVADCPEIIAECPAVIGHCLGTVGHCPAMIADCSGTVGHCPGTIADCPAIVADCLGTIKNPGFLSKSCKTSSRGRQTSGPVEQPREHHRGQIETCSGARRHGDKTSWTVTGARASARFNVLPPVAFRHVFGSRGLKRHKCRAPLAIYELASKKTCQPFASGAVSKT
jgi:hypothetical protein